MRSRLELTRFALRVLGLCLLLWCWWMIVGDLMSISGSLLTGNPGRAGYFLNSAWSQATRLFSRDISAPFPQPIMDFNWSLLTWWFRLALGLYLVFRGEGLARLLWRGIPTTRCPSCGYDRAGLANDATCPECGSKP